ncbi:Methyltransferase domain protein [Micromonospora sp. MW-13]|uniref:class I SAM-dependent methyltransferase n=1 Tax=Micromonospora sp. MW-13 TaxID=2094022 RepID=UPI000E43E980|nr:class I SAM-dependent methyltransferase [Micromonospora sp. MW-13]RGC68149.1 Methyltransferase domain protein [Micromonospora sp. MW-13]
MTTRVALWPPDPSRPAQWWDEFWAQRDQDFGPPSERVVELAEEFLAARGAATAVDVASGNGRYAVPLARMGYAVTAIEYTSSGAARIRDAATAQGVRLAVEQGDFLVLGARPRPFDLVLSSGLLEEVPAGDQLRALEGYVRWTAPHGRNIVKYCLEIDGRGPLVADGLVPRFYERLGWDLRLVRENQAMKPSRAGIVLRTGTVAADRR